MAAGPPRGYLNPRSYYWGLRAQMRHLVKYFDKEPRIFAAGEQIARPELPLPGAYYIESGFVQANDDSDVTLATRGIVYEPGESFGEYALERQPDPAFPAYLRALTEVKTWFLSPVRFEEAKKRERNIKRLVQKIQSRVRLNEILPDLIAALSRSAPAKDVPRHRIVDEAKLGVVVELRPGKSLQAIAKPADAHSRSLPQWFYVAEGSLSAKGVVLPKGSVFLWPSVNGLKFRADDGLDRSENQGSGRTLLVQLRRGLARYLRRTDLERLAAPTSARAAPRRFKRQAVMIGFRCEREWGKMEIPFSAIAALLADALSEVPGVRSVGLWIIRPGRVQRRREQRGRVKVRYLSETAISTETGYEDFVVIDALDPEGWPSSWVGEKDGFVRPLTKLVIIGTSPAKSALPLFSDGRKGEARPDIIRSVILRQDNPIGDYVAYHPGTVRLAFDDINRLPTLAATREKLSQRDRHSIERLARAVTEMRVGLALGGGGAWGYAHIALIQELEKVGIPIDMVSGVSFGSLVAAFYAVGGTRQLDVLINKGQLLKYYLMLSGLLPFPNIAHDVIDILLGCPRLELLETPFFPVGLNLNSGEEWSVGKGTVGYGTRSASAMPGLLPPLIDVGRGLRMVDGAFVNNVPEGVLLRERADVILASDVVEKAVRRRETPWTRFTSFMYGPSRLEDSLRATAVLMQIGNDRDRSIAMDTFRPPATEFSALAFDKAWEISEWAREEAARFARGILLRYKPGPLIRDGAPEGLSP